MIERAHGRDHGPAFHISVVFATDNVAVGIGGFPFEAASVLTQGFDVE